MRNRGECRRAAREIGLGLGRPFTVTVSIYQQGCIKWIDDNLNLVYYNNVGVSPSRDGKSKAVCRVKKTTTTTGSGESSFFSCIIYA